MLTRLSRTFSTAMTTISKGPIAEYFLKVVAVPQLPKLQPKPHKYLLKNWWSVARFGTKTPLSIPVFSLKTGEFIRGSWYCHRLLLELNQDIFNQPLRRDLIFRLYRWRMFLNKFRTHSTRNITRTASSGAKVAAQKGRGKARMGKNRAPGRWKGGKAHGAKPKVYSYHLNEKIKLNALKALLTSRLF